MSTPLPLVPAPPVTAPPASATPITAVADVHKPEPAEPPAEPADADPDAAHSSLDSQESSGDAGDATAVRALFSGKSLLLTLVAQLAGSAVAAPAGAVLLPLLALTPPAVAKTLTRAYPYILATDRLLGILTWTCDDTWLPILVVLAYNATVLYYAVIVTYTGHLVAVALVAWAMHALALLARAQTAKPTLDDAVAALTRASVKADMLVLPFTRLRLTAEDLRRLLFTTIFLTPLYILGTFFFATPLLLLCAAGLFVLTYHLRAARVLRRIAWLLRLVRLVCFFLTGLHFGATPSLHRDALQLLRLAMAKVATSDGSKPVRFTYVLYENQRRWLGVGWTANLLGYERTPWTDEFLNELVATGEFVLPEADGLDMAWRWIDKSWRLDLTNDGALQLPRARLRTTADPGSEDGWVFFDNTWKKPLAEDSFSKYTRRRRWIRTAELVGGAAEAPLAEPPAVVETSAELSARDETKARKRRSIRFEEPEAAT